MRRLRHNPVPSMLRRRRVIKVAAISIIGLTGIIAVLDHFGAFGFRGSDWSRFDHRSFVVTRVIDGDTLVISADGNEAIVGLLGVDAPDLPGSYWSDRAAKYT